MTQKENYNSKSMLSLAEAGKMSGYHQDYLRFLCRTGKLNGQKLGRNWCVSEEDLQLFLQSKKKDNAFEAQLIEPQQSILTLPEARDTLEQDEILQPTKKSTKSFASFKLTGIILSPVVFVFLCVLSLSLLGLHNAPSKIVSYFWYGKDNDAVQNGLVKEEEQSGKVLAETTTAVTYLKPIPLDESKLRKYIDDYFETLFKNGTLCSPLTPHCSSNTSSVAIGAPAVPQASTPPIPQIIIPGGYVAPQSSQNFGGATIFSATTLSADDLIGKDLTVSHNARISGDLTVSGSISGTFSGGINLGFTSGSVAFQGASGLTQDNANLFYDNTNNRLGLGNNAPTAVLDITTAADTTAINETGYSLTGSNAQSLVSLTGTWNTTGTPTLIFANVTDIASNAASALLDLQVGGVSKFKVDKGGNLTVTSCTGCGGGGSSVFSDLVPATATNAINNADYQQTWAWNTLSGNGLVLSSSSTTAAGNAQKLFSVALSGANATSTQTTYGSYITNTHTGTSSTNVAGYFSASGGANNYAAIFENGNVGIGTTAPTSALQVVGTVSVTKGLFGDGSLALPSIARASNTGTGISFSASNHAIQFSLGGSEVGGYQNVLNPVGQYLINGNYFGWAATGSSTMDLVLGREAAAVLQLGVDINGTPADQTIKALDGVVGTDISGGNLIVAAGRGTGSGGGGTIAFQTASVLGSGTTAQTLATRMTIAKDGNVGIGTTSPGSSLHAITTNSATNTTTNILTLGHNTSGTPAASYGSGILIQGQSSTTANRDMAQISSIWTTATDASRTSALIFSGVNNGGGLSELGRFIPGSTPAFQIGPGDSAGRLKIVPQFEGDGLTIDTVRGYASTGSSAFYNISSGYGGEAAHYFRQLSPMTANSTYPMLILQRGSNYITNASNGFGTGIRFEAVTSDNSVYSTLGQIDAIWTTITHGSRTSAITFSTVNNASASTEVMRILGNGNVGIGTTSPVSLLTIGSATPTTAASGLNFGTDTSANLYRSAAATIKTDGTFNAAIALQVAGVDINTGGTLTNVAYLDQANVFSTTNTFNKAGIGTTSTDGIVLQNSTAAAAGAQQYSPRLRLTGQGWKTTATAASQTVDFIQEVIPVQGTANPTAYLNIASQINAGGYTNRLTIQSDGNVGINTLGPLAQLSVVSSTASKVGAIFNTASSPSADIAQFNVNGTNMAGFNNMGGLYLNNNSSVSGALITVNNVQTWNGGTLLTWGTGPRLVISDDGQGYGAVTLQAAETNFIIKGAANRTTGTGIIIPASAAGVSPLAVRGAGSQTANLQEWQNSSGTALASISSGGSLTISSGSVAVTPSDYATAGTFSAVIPNGSTDLTAYGRGLRTSSTSSAQWMASGLSVTNFAGRLMAGVYGVNMEASTYDKGGLLFTTAPSLGSFAERLFIDDTGKVGINLGIFNSSNTIDAQLHTLSGSASRIAGQFQGAASNTAAVLVSKSGSSGTGNLFEAQNSSGIVRASIDSGGNILTLGTAADNTPGIIKLSSTGNANGRIYFDNAGSYQIIAGGQSATMDFYLSGSNKMTILSGGNVGIGTTSPAQKLAVAGSIDLNLNGSPSIGNNSYGGNSITFANTGVISIASPNHEVTINGSQTSGSADQVSFQVAPSVGKSSTTGYTALLINPTLTTLGSGSNYLFDARGSSSSRIVMTTTGNVGIGTTTTLAHLDIVPTSQDGTTIGIRTVRNTGADAFRYVSNDDPTVTVMGIDEVGYLYGSWTSGTNQAGGDLNLSGGLSTGNANGGGIGFYAASAGSSGDTRNEATDLRMYMSQSGNFSIGTATPTARLHVQKDSIGTTSTDGILLTNTTNAANNAQQYSPRLHLSGRGWKTNATAASQAVDWIAQVVPVQGTANPSSYLDLSASINGGAYSNVMALSSGGNVGIGTTVPTSGRLQLARTADTDTLIYAKAVNGGIGDSGRFISYQNSTGDDLFYISGTGSLYTTASASTVNSHTGFYISGGWGNWIQDTDKTTITTAYGLKITSDVSNPLGNSNPSSASFLDIRPTINQSGANGYTAVNIDVTESATGSGAKYLFNAKVGGSSKFVIESGGNVGIGTATPAAKFDVNATCTNFETSHQCTDYAEVYPAQEAIEMGEIVTIDSATTKNSIVKKARRSYDSGIIGVVSTNPAIVVEGNSVQLMSGANYTHDPLRPAIALAGRVPVKVTNENGSIQPGDYLTASDTFPGYAMKATRSGQVIGQALESFDATSGQTGGQIIVFIKIGYQVIGNTFVLGDLGDQTTGNVGAGTPQTQNSVFLINQEGTNEIMKLQAAGADRLVVHNNGSMEVLASVTILDDLVLRVANTSSDVFTINARGVASFAGTIVIQDNTFAGSVATDAAGEKQIMFSYPMTTGKPVVELTVEGEVPAFAQVVSFQKDNQNRYIGFTIKTFGVTGSPMSTIVHYIVVGKQSGYGTDGQVVQVITTPTGNSATIEDILNDPLPEPADPPEPSV